MHAFGNRAQEMSHAPTEQTISILAYYGYETEQLWRNLKSGQRDQENLGMEFS